MQTRKLKRKTKAKAKAKAKRLRLPRLLLQAYAMVAILLVPWALWLSYSLPVDHMDYRWNLAWSIFDLGMLVSMGATAYFGMRKSGWIVMAATSTGTFLVIDAWFDCVTAKNAWEHLLSISSAAFIELPLGLLAFWLAYRAGKQFLVVK